MPSAGMVGLALSSRISALEQDGIEQLVDTIARDGAALDVDRVAAPLLGLQALGGELAANAVGMGVGPVDLVDRDDDGDLRRAGVVDGLLRLGHHPVVGGHDQDDHVGRLSAARAHGGECLVAGRVDEDHRTGPRLDAVGADVLRDAAGFGADHVRVADAVEQRGLAVVDVTHDRHDGRAEHPIGDHILELTTRRLDDLLLGAGDVLDLVAELAREDLRRVGVEGAVDVHAAHAQLHELHQDVGRLEAHALGELLQLDLGLDADDALLGARDRDLGLLALLAGRHLLATRAALGSAGRAEGRASELTATRGIGPTRRVLGHDARAGALGQRCHAGRHRAAAGDDAGRQVRVGKAHRCGRRLGGAAPAGGTCGSDRRDGGRNRGRLGRRCNRGKRRGLGLDGRRRSLRWLRGHPRRWLGRGRRGGRRGGGRGLDDGHRCDLGRTVACRRTLLPTRHGPSPDDRRTDPFLDRTGGLLFLHRSLHPVGVCRLQHAHVVAHLDPQRSDLLDELLDWEGPARGLLRRPEP